MLIARIMMEIAVQITRLRTPTILLLLAISAVFFFINFHERERSLSNFKVTVQGWPLICEVNHAAPAVWERKEITPEVSQYLRELAYARQVFGLEPASSARPRKRSARFVRITVNILVALIVSGGCCAVMERYILKPRSGDMQ